MPALSFTGSNLVQMAKYNVDLRGDVAVEVNPSPKVKVHRAEWKKVMEGEPIEINPSTGNGFRVMSAAEWAGRWKRNDDFPTCEACKGQNTKEHYFSQTWCRGRRMWASESLCLDCLNFTYRSYKDPDFTTPEDFEKKRWEQLAAC